MDPLMVVLEKLIQSPMVLLQFIMLVAEVDIEHLALHLQVDKVVLVVHLVEQDKMAKPIKAEDLVVVDHLIQVVKE
jgi:hypothetical protein